MKSKFLQNSVLTFSRLFLMLLSCFCIGNAEAQTLVTGGSGVIWQDMVNATDNTTQANNAGISDANLITDVVFADVNNVNHWQAAGLIWATSQSSISSIKYYNGTTTNIVNENGIFSANIKVQSSVDGIAWIDISGWTILPAYPYDVNASEQIYTFSGAAINNVKGVRVVGQLRTSANEYSTSWSIKVKEVAAYSGSGTFDTEAPSIPTGLNSLNVTDSSFNLSWIAATDNIAVTQYEIFKDGISIGTSVTNSFAVTGLAASTTYNMSVRARDAAGNWSAQSTAVAVKTATPLPTGYRYLRLTALGSVSAYEIYITEIDWLAGGIVYPTTNANAGSADVTASFNQANAYKLSDGIKTNASIWEGTTTFPQDIRFDLGAGVAINPTSVQVSIEWNGRAMSQFRCDGSNDSTTWTTFYTSPVLAESDWVRDATNTFVIVAGSADTQAPSAPTVLVASDTTSVGFNLTWNAATDNVGVTGYDVYKNGTLFGTTAAGITTLNITGLNYSTSYSMTVKAKDAAGNISAASTAINVTTLPYDPTQTSSAIITFETANLGNVGSVSYSEAGYTLEDGQLTENLQILGTAEGYASKTIFNSNFDRTIRLRKTDNAAFNLTSFDYAGGVWGDLADATVTGFLVGGGTVTSSTSSSSKAYTNLILNWTNLLKVEINFSAGTNTDYGALDNFMVSLPPPDTIAPSIPATLASSNIAPTTFTLAWVAATDNIGVVQYEIYKDGVLADVTNGSTLTLNLTGLTAATNYSMTVKAVDAAGNKSAASIALVVTTDAPDTTPPSVPTGLVVSSVASSSFRLTWQASTDNYAVSRYIVYLGTDSVGTTTALTYTFLNLTAATTYNAKVVAVDNSYNKSAASAAVSATTAAFQLEGFTENFNDGNIDGWNGGSYGLSNEANTLKVVANKGGNVWSAFSYAFNLVDISLYPYITFKVKSKFDVNITVAVGNLPAIVDAYPSRLQTIDQIQSQEIISGNSEWQEYTFDFTGVTHADLTKVDYAQFLVNYLGTVNSLPDSNIFYIEDLRIGKDAKSMAAVTSLRDISFSTGTIVPKKIQFYGLTDGSDGTHPLTITATSSNTAIVPTPVIDYTAPAKTGMITITPNNGVTGQAIITLKIAAAGVQDKLSTFKVTVTGNQQPFMKPLTNLLANIGDTIKIPLLSISDGDADEEQTIAISATSNNATILPAGNILVQHSNNATTGVLKIVAAPTTVSGSTAQVTVFLKDNGGIALNGVDSNKYTFNVTFYTQVNKTPTLIKTGIVRLAARVQPYSLLLKGITDGDDGTQTLTATVTALTNTVGTGYTVGAISNGTASLNFNLTGNIGTDKVVVRIRDNGGAGNNGALFIEDTITIIGNAAPQTWFVNNFDDAGAITAWYGDASAHTLTVENQQLHIHTNIQALTYPGINVDLLAQTGGKYVDVSGKKYISFNMKAATTNTNNPGTISIALIDEDALAAGYYTRTIFTQNVPADGLVHHYVFNYNNKFYTQNNLTLDSTHIKALLINIDNDYFNAYTGDYYIDDFKMGDSAEVTFTPVNTIANVSDQTYLIGQTPSHITLTGISDGAGQNATGLTVSANNAVVQNLAVTPATNGSSQLSFSLNTTVTDSSVIRIIADNPAISTDIPDTIFIKVFVVDTATAANSEVKIDLTKKFQTMIGLGSTALSNSEEGFQKTSEQNITLMRIFGEFDEMENQNDNGDPYTLNTDNLTIDQSRLDFYKKINETTTCHKFFYTVLGPPAWLKTNKSRYPDPNTLWADNNRLNPGLYEEYAEFLTAIIKIFKEKAGIELYAISLQNEPQFNEPYPSCQISGAEFAAIIKVVGKRFEREGITTRIIMPEDVGLSWAQEKVNPVIADTAAVKYLDIIAVHNYGENGITAGGGSQGAWQDTYNWFKTTPGKDLWMTETSGFSNKWEGELIESYLNPGQYDYAPGPFGFSGFMFSALKSGKISAWVDLDSKEGSASIRSAFKQYSKFVEPGSIMVDAQSFDNDILSVAFKNPADNSLSIILYNTTYAPKRIQITGEGVPLKYTSVYTANNVNFEPGAETQNGYYLLPPRSIVTLKSLSAILPVSLVNLKANRVQKTIDVSWKTQAENNNKGFYIQRSADGINFVETLGYAATKAHGGFSINTLSYTFKDAVPLSGRNYYRLKQEDIDGRFVYSNIAYADMDAIKAARVLNIRPNPVTKNQQLSVLVETITSDMVTLEIVDIYGRIIAQKATSLTNGSNVVTITTSTFAPGVYYFKLISKNQYQNNTQPFVVQ